MRLRRRVLGSEFIEGTVIPVYERLRETYERAYQESDSPDDLAKLDALQASVLDILERSQSCEFESEGCSPSWLVEKALVDGVQARVPAFVPGPGGLEPKRLFEDLESKVTAYSQWAQAGDLVSMRDDPGAVFFYLFKVHADAYKEIALLFAGDPRYDPAGMLAQKTDCPAPDGGATIASSIFLNAANYFAQEMERHTEDTFFAAAGKRVVGHALQTYCRLYRMKPFISDDAKKIFSAAISEGKEPAARGQEFSETYVN